MNLFNSKAAIWLFLALYVLAVAILGVANSASKETIPDTIFSYAHSGLGELSIALFVLSLSWILDAKQEIAKHGNRARWFKVSQLLSLIIVKDEKFGSDPIFDLYTELASMKTDPVVITNGPMDPRNLNIANIQENILSYLGNVLFHANFSKTYRNKPVSTDTSFVAMLHLLKAKVQSEMLEGVAGNAT